MDCLRRACPSPTACSSDRVSACLTASSEPTGDRGKAVEAEGVALCRYLSRSGHPICFHRFSRLHGHHNSPFQPIVIRCHWRRTGIGLGPGGVGGWGRGREWEGARYLRSCHLLAPLPTRKSPSTNLLSNSPSLRHPAPATPAPPPPPPHRPHPTPHLARSLRRDSVARRLCHPSPGALSAPPISWVDPPPPLCVPPPPPRASSLLDPPGSISSYNVFL